MKLLRFLLAALVAAAVLGSCGGDDAPDTALEDPVASVSPDGGTNDSAAGDTRGDDSSADATCTTMAEDAAQTQGDRSFPDNPGTTFTVNSSAVQSDGRVLVAVTPVPDVGYRELAFLSACAGGTAVLHGAYFAEAGGWVLLFTTDEGDAAGAPAEVDAA